MKAYITDSVPEPSIEREILKERLSNRLTDEVSVLLVWNKEIDSKFIDHVTNLKGIVRYGVGFENINVEYAASKNIVVCNTPDYGTEEVSDTAIAMILNITRGVSIYDFRSRDYRSTWQENKIRTLRRTSSCVLGVVGAGRIGGSVILKARALRFRTLFYDPYKERGYEKLLGSERAETFKQLVSSSDIVSFHVPLTHETMGMIDKNMLSWMKRGASIVNTARGGVVADLDLLYDALKSGYLASAALDVLPEEPPVESKLIRAWRNQESWVNGRLLINPHTAFYSTESYREMREKAANNALRLLTDLNAYNIVTPSSYFA